MAKFEMGDKVSATVKAKIKRKMVFTDFPHSGLLRLETTIISPSFNIVGIVFFRRKKTGGKVKIVQTESGKAYRWDRLTNIKKIEPQKEE